MPLFTPFRAIGYICDSTPAIVQRRGKESFVTASVGKAWQIYNCAKLSLVFVGPLLEKNIRALASWRDLTFAAYGSNVAVFNRAKLVATWRQHTDKVTLLLTFGDHLISVGRDRQMLIWRADSASPDGDLQGSIQLAEDFNPTSIMHPDTYLNKVLIGSKDGRLQLWNISSRKMIFEFSGWQSAVRSMCSSPALDVAAIACSNGRVFVHNLKYDKTVVTFTHTDSGAATAVAFRTDGQAVLAVGGSDGMITLWDLENKKLKAVIKDAHDSWIVSLYFFPQEPILMSTGADNSIKMWIFDTADGEARLLRFRSGHSAPPSCISYYGNGRHILSAGQDRAFRVFSTIQDQQSRELSQGHVTKRAKKRNVREDEVKLTKVVAFAAEEIRARDWCNVVTCHDGDSCAYTWRLQNFVIGEHMLKPPGGDLTAVKSCAITACGNFAILGTISGRVDRFNLQSGKHRGSYQMTKQQYAPAHRGTIIGLQTDATNSQLFTAGFDGHVKIWNFKSGQLKADIDVGLPLTKLVYHRTNALLAVACDDLVLRVYDSLAYKLVRKFKGHVDRITDVCLSHDGRWMMTSSMDRTVRTWDLVSGRQLDAFQSDVAVTGLSLSPGMDMLATVHVNQNGIFLWANKMMYSSTEDALTFGSGLEIASVSMPSVATEFDTKRSEGVENPIEVVVKTEPASPKSADLALLPEENDVVPGIPELVSLAMLPRTQWLNLVKLDIIRERNKPVAPPKKPEQAPFFLPTIPTVSGKTVFALPDDTVSKQTESRVKRKADTKVNHRSKFVELLHDGRRENDYRSLVDLLKTMSPSAVDLELQLMEVVESFEDAREEQIEEISLLLHFLFTETQLKQNFELVQAILHRSLTIHGDIISKNELLKDQAKALLQVQTKSWSKVDSLFQSVRCMAAFLSSTQG